MTTLTRPALMRLLATTLSLGGLLAITGALGSSGDAFLLRLTKMEAYAVAGLCLGLSCNWILGRFHKRPLGQVQRKLTGAGLMCVPVALSIWTISAAGDFTGDHLARLPLLVLISFIVCAAMTFVFFAVPRDKALSVAATVRHTFSDRLPAPFRSGTLWSVCADDHFLRIGTSRGSTHIGMRFADAVRELSADDGAQVHRSWWVASVAVTKTRRFDGRATLTLVDGTQVPVSRRFARELRERGWL